MQLEDEIAKEFADIIKEHLGEYRAKVRDIETKLAEVEGRSLDDAPMSMVDEIAKAIAMVAEAPPLTQGAGGNPVVVNFSPQNAGKKIKTITTRRDEAGNLVARVIED